MSQTAHTDALKELRENPIMVVSGHSPPISRNDLIESHNVTVRSIFLTFFMLRSHAGVAVQPPANHRELELEKLDEKQSPDCASLHDSLLDVASRERGAAGNFFDNNLLLSECVFLHV